MNAPENKTKVIIFTGNYQIRGEIAHFSDTRLTDYMNEANAFIAVTNAEVLNCDEKQLVAVPFLNVGLEKIEVIVPANE